jgi:hypothetical protein
MKRRVAENKRRKEEEEEKKEEMNINEGRGASLLIHIWTIKIAPF